MMLITDADIADIADMYKAHQGKFSMVLQERSGGAKKTATVT